MFKFHDHKNVINLVYHPLLNFDFFKIIFLCKKLWCKQILNLFLKFLRNNTIYFFCNNLKILDFVIYFIFYCA